MVHFVDAAGGPVDVGRAQGEALKEPIRELIERLLEEICRIQKAGTEEVFTRIAPYFAHLERELPHLHSESLGIAEGAGISYREAQLLNFQGEARLRRIDGCTSFAFAHGAGRKLIVGQNVDMPPLFSGLHRVMRIVPLQGPSLLMWGFVGTVGQRGLNSAGVALVGNGLGGPRWRPGVSSIVADRIALECETVARGIERVRGITRAKATNMLFGDADGRIVDVEWTVDDLRCIEGGDGIAHANNYLHPEFVHLEAPLIGLEESPERARHAEALLDRAGDSADAVRAMQAMLSDHVGLPRSICRHDLEPPHPNVTIASLVAIPDERVLLVSDGPPCCSAYAKFALQ